MSVKKSRATGKSSSTRRSRSTNSEAVTAVLAGEVQDVATSDKDIQDKAASNLSSRASRKVAAEKSAGESSDRNDAPPCAPLSQDEGGSMKQFPSRRVWPD